MIRKITQWGVGLLSMLVLFVGTSSAKLPSYFLYYQPKVPKALRRDR